MIWIFAFWIPFSLLVCLGIGAAIRRADREDRRYFGLERQCGFLFKSGERCVWYNGHRWDHDPVSKVFPNGFGRG